MRTRLLVVGTWLCFLGACGGGGGNSAPAPAPPPPNNGPVLPQPPTGSPPDLSFSLDRPILVSGESVTLTWRSSGTGCTASGGWTGTKALTGSEVVGPVTQSTSFVISCDGVFPYRAVTGTVRVWVDSAAPQAPTSVKVYSRRSSLDFVKSPPFDARDLVWDSANNVFHVITRATSANHASSLLTLNTRGEILRASPLGSEPVALALSANAQYVYVGFADGSGIRRLPAGSAAGPILQIPIPGGMARVIQIAGSPTNDETFAVLGRGLSGIQSDLDELAVFNNATPRSRMLANNPNDPTSNLLDLQALLAFRSGSLIYVSASAPRGLLEVNVDAQGLTITRVRPEFYVASGYMSGSRIYSDDGRVLDIDGPVGQLGTFNDSQPAVSPPKERVAHVASGKAFEINGATIIAYDLESYVTLDEIAFTGAAQASGSKLITWGTNGLAFGGTEGVVIAQGSFAQSGGGPPNDQYELPISSASTAIKITDTVTRAYDYYNYRVFDIGATDAERGSCGRFFVTTSRRGIRPNRVVQVGNGWIITSAPGGSNPDRVAISGDCGKIYVGQAGSDSIRRIDRDMSLDTVIPVDSQFRNGEFSRAAAIAPAFGEPLTIAVARTRLNDTSCDAPDRGLTIFDDRTERPAPYSASPHRIQGIVWGPNAQTLFTEDETQSSVFTVDVNGPRDPRALFPYPHAVASRDLYRDLQYDNFTARLYNSFGTVFDTAANRTLGSVQLRVGTAIAPGGCSAPNSAMALDGFGEKIFWVRAGDNGGLDVETYDARTFALISTMSLTAESIGRSTGFGVPKRVFIVDSFTLVVLTDWGYLVEIFGLRLR